MCFLLAETSHLVLPSFGHDVLVMYVQIVFFWQVCLKRWNIESKKWLRERMRKRCSSCHPKAYVTLFHWWMNLKKYKEVVDLMKLIKDTHTWAKRLTSKQHTKDTKEEQGWNFLQPHQGRATVTLLATSSVFGSEFRSVTIYECICDWSFYIVSHE
jgi:hypothetical protein